jgi:Asp-tRNA(Asn)/Glu-tRNA(Gln) amidotransferase A subunit family amidase
VKPQDAGVDRRAFLARMGALSAAVASGSALGPVAGVALPVVGFGVSDGVGSPVQGEPGAPGPGFDPGVRPPHVDAEAFWASARAELLDRGIGPDRPEELTAWEAGVLIRDGALTPEALVERCLGRIQALDPLFQAFNTVVAEEARAQARAPGEGLLAGIPVAIKDNVYTRGVRTTANAHMFQDFVPEEDATLVARLKAAGGVVVGKTQMGPLATTRALTPDGEVTTLSAWAPDDARVSPGGSSSGSATAVAARMVTTSMGTQTGGSITVPASSQGLTGLKPTLGRISLRGVIPLTYTRDHPGPISRDARDAALLLQVMAGPDPLDPRTLGLPEVPDYLAAATPVGSGSGSRVRWPTRLGVLPGWAEGNAPGAARRRAFLQAMEEGGVELVSLELPPGWGELGSGVFNAGRLPERSEPFLPWLREDVRLFGVTLSSWIQGLLLSGDEYLKAQRARLALLRLAMDEVFTRCDVVVQPSHLPFDMIGLPLITFPVGLREPGEGGGGPGGGYAGVLPEGVILGAGPFGEERLLSLAALWQARTDHHRARPAEPTVEARRRGARSRGRMDVVEVAEASE